MANSALKTKLAAIRKSVDERVFKVLVPVELERRNDEISAGTGRRGFEAAVVVDAKIAGYARRYIESERTTDDAQYRVTLYEVAAGTGDRITWNDEAHEVLTVRGLVKDADGSRYRTEVLIN